MDECLQCGDSSDDLLLVAPDDRSEAVAGQICRDCETELVWTGIEVGPAGTCGYSDRCNRTAAYATIDTDVETNQKRNNLLCGYHLSKLES